MDKRFVFIIGMVYHNSVKVLPKNFDLDMITEDYVTFETAKLMKENGFKGIGNLLYDFKGNQHLFKDWWWDITPKERYKSVECPTHQMAMKWLREEHTLFVDVKLLSGSSYQWFVWFMNDPQQIIGCSEDTPIHFYDDYNACAEAAIKYCLENLIN